jgi:hypothetical protein
LASASAWLRVKRKRDSVDPKFNDWKKAARDVP